MNSTHRNLVLDASVLINLLGTRCPGGILRALHRVALIDEITLKEVNIDPATRKSAEASLRKLEADGCLKVVSMDAEAYELFISLTGAQPPDDLDDGEAATLAQAARNGYVAVVDERKATRIAAKQRPAIEILNSLDLIAASELQDEMDYDCIAEALFLALRDARMRVPADYRKWVETVIGAERCSECSSLRSARTL